MASHLGYACRTWRNGIYLFVAQVLLLLLVASLVHASDVHLSIQTGHAREVIVASYSLNGRLIATGGFDGAINIWDAKSARQIISFGGHTSPVTQIAFSPNGRYIASAQIVSSSDLLVSIRDSQTGKVIQNIPVQALGISFLTFSPNNSLLAVGEPLHGVSVWRVGDEDMHPVAEFLRDTVHREQVVCGEFGRDNDTLAVGDNYGIIRRFSVNRRVITGEVIVTPSAIESLALGTVGSKTCIISGHNDGNLLIHLLEEEKTLSYRLPSLEEGVPVSVLALDEKNLFLLYGGGEHVAMLDLKQGRVQPERGNLSGSVCRDIDLNTHQVLFSRGNSVEVWDFASRSQLWRLPGSTHQVHQVSFGMKDELWIQDKQRNLRWSPKSFDHTRLYSVSSAGPTAPLSDGILLQQNSSGRFRFMDLQTGKKWELPERSEVKSVSISANRKYVLLVTHNEHHLWQLQPLKKLSSRKIETDETSVACLSPQGDLVVSVRISWKGSLPVNHYIIRSRQGVVQHDITSKRPSSVTCIAFSPNNRWLALGRTDGNIEILQVGQWQQPRFLTGRHNGSVSCVAFSPDGALLATGSADTQLKVWNITNGKLLSAHSAHKENVTDVAFSKHGNLLATSSTDGTVNLYDSVGMKARLKLTLVVGDYEQIALLTPSGFYAVPPGMRTSLAFRTDLRSYPFEEFDLFLNRPDRVLGEINSEEKELISLYKAAYMRRVQRFGVNQQTFSQLMANEFRAPSVASLITRTPQIDSITPDVPPVSPTKQLSPISVAIRSRSGSALRSINVTVNGVPAFGPNGILIGGNRQAATVTIPTVELSTGMNRIGISVACVDGTQSVYAPIYTYHKDDGHKPRVFVVAVGVTKYALKESNLKYAAADAVSVIKAFGYGPQPVGLNHVLLTDKSATKGAILTMAKELFKQASVDDETIFFLAGHGTLDEKSNSYYFCTYNTDFDVPRQGGLSLNDIEEVLASSSSRKKLVLLDSCYSGETDPIASDRTAALQQVNDRQQINRGKNRGKKRHGGVKFRARPGHFTIQNPAFAKMQELFVDLRQSDGTLVIAATTGFGASQEQERLGHGVFTYSLLEALQRKITMVAEVRDYVFRRVPQLAKDQKPTMRRENLGNNWDILTGRPS